MVKIYLSGQSIGEYAVCLAVILAALLAMQVYVKRGLEGRYKGVVDYATKQAYPLTQYEPGYVQDKYTVSQDKKLTESAPGGGNITRNPIEDKTVVTGTSTRDVK